MKNNLSKITAFVFSFSFLTTLCNGVRANNTELTFSNNAQYSKLQNLGDQAYSEGDYQLAIKYYLQLAELKNNNDKLAVKFSLLKALIADNELVEAQNLLKKLKKIYAQNQRFLFWLPLYQANIAIAENRYHSALTIINESTPQYRNVEYSNANQSLPNIPKNELNDFKIEFLSASAFLSQSMEQYQAAAKKYRLLLKLLNSLQKDELIYQAQRNFIYCSIKNNDLNAANAMLSLLLKNVDSQEKSTRYTELNFLKLYALAMDNSKSIDSIHNFYQKIKDNLTLNSDSLRYEVDSYIIQKIKSNLSYQEDKNIERHNLKFAIDFMLDAYKIAPSSVLRKNILKEIINSYAKIADYNNSIIWSNLYINFYDNNSDNSEIAIIKYRLAALYRLNGDFNKAANLYLELAKSNSLSEEQRKQAIFDGGHLFLKLKNYAAAENLFSLLVKDNTITVQAQGKFLLAETLLAAQKYQKSAELFEEVAKNSAEFHDKALLNTFIAYINGKDKKNSLRIYKDLMAKVSDENIKITSQFYYCKIALIANDVKKAAEEYYEFSENFPSNNLRDKALFNSGELYYSIQEYKLAVEIYNTFINQYPNNINVAQALYKIIYCNFLLNDLTAVTKIIKRMKKQFPNNKYTVAAIFYMNRFYQETSDYQKAFDNLTFLINSKKIASNTKALASYEIANIYFAQQDFAKSKQQLEQLAAKYPASDVNANAFYLQGDIASLEKDYQSAVKYFNQAIQRRPLSDLAFKSMLRIADCNYMLELKNNKIIAKEHALKELTNNSKKNKDKTESTTVLKSQARAKYFYLNLAIKNYKQLISGNVPQLNNNEDISDLVQEVQNQVFYCLGQCYELKEKDDEALIYYQSAINNYLLHYDSGYVTSDKFFIHSAYAAVNILLRKRTPEAILEAIKIYQKLQHAQVNIGDNYNNLIKDLRAKFKL